jgi:hypothetical protein
MTLIRYAGGALSRAVGGEFVKPREDRAVAAMAVDEAVQRVATEPPALCALDAEHGELADEVSRGERAVAGNWGHVRFRITCDIAAVEAQTSSVANDP